MRIKQIIKLIFTLIYLQITLLIVGCKTNSQMRDAEIEKNALKISESFDATKIDIFRKWRFFKRGTANVWDKISGDSCIYRCVYLDKKSSIILRVQEPNNFMYDFNKNIQIDTSFWQIIIVQYNDGLMNLYGVNRNGIDVPILNNIKTVSIFISQNPFKKFKELSELSDSFQFYSVDYYKRLGGIIRFNLSTQHSLYYIPDIELIDPEVKQIWKDRFQKGKQIKKNWILIKLDKPIDN